MNEAISPRNISLNPLWHSFMPAYQHIIGVSTTLFSAFAYFLMVTKTPSSGKDFVKYLMLVQAFVSLIDLNLGFLTCPILPLPITGYLCNGVICTWFGLSVHVGIVESQHSISITFYATGLLSVSMIYCFHYKYVKIHQMIGCKSHPASRHALFRALLLFIYVLPGTLQVGLFRNLAGGREYVRSTFPSMYYLIEDTSYRTFVYDLNLYPTYFAIFSATNNFVLFLSAFLVSYFVSRSFSALSKQNSLSEKTRELQHQLIIALLIQMLIPLLIQMAPVLINSYSILTLSLNPDINNVLLCFQLTHAFAHTTVLIVSTPSYRAAILRRKHQMETPSTSRFFVRPHLSISHQ